jgi:hypothetical protein
VTEAISSRPSRILAREQVVSLSMNVLSAIDGEAWKDAAHAQFPAVDEFVTNAIKIIQNLESATHQTHPEIHDDTDVIYIDSGPGPYSYKALEPGKTELEDTSYHKWSWSRKMDRARIRAAYTLAAIITANRLEQATGKKKALRDLAPEDFEKYSPYLEYTTVDWQAKHIRRALSNARDTKLFNIPDNKLVMYEEFINEQDETQPITHTEDQIEGLHFPQFNKKPPRRGVIVSHPAHLMRILHILGRYPKVIPEETTLQLFPIPTPVGAAMEYAKAELLGTLGTVFKKGRATLTPYTNYEL